MKNSDSKNNSTSRRVKVLVTIVMYNFFHVEFVIYDVTSSFILGLETANVPILYLQRFGFAQAQQ